MRTICGQGATVTCKRQHLASAHMLTKLAGSRVFERVRSSAANNVPKKPLLQRHTDGNLDGVYGSRKRHARFFPLVHDKILVHVSLFVFLGSDHDSNSSNRVRLGAFCLRDYLSLSGATDTYSNVI